jgi:tRNA threonylcarbamoyladenosine biosynthesis protein TsaB
MANLLAIEAASDSCSVALHIDNKVIERTEAAPRMHSRLLYPMLNTLMQEAGITPKQLDAVIFGKGPGSFTGLRIAAATAQGIGFACDLPLIGISTLQAMAQQTRQTFAAESVLSIMDARMNELYVGHYHWDNATQLMIPSIKDQICPNDCSLKMLNINEETGLTACGHGLKLTDKLDDSIRNITEQDANQILNASSLIPEALSLYQQNQVLKPEEVELSYLREQTHWKTIKQQIEFKNQQKSK